MNERLVELRAALADVRRRWTERSVLRAWVLAAATAATVLLAGLVAILVGARTGVPLVVVVAISLAMALFGIVRALWPLRRRPNDTQIARFVEERAGGLDDVLVTAVDYAERPEASPEMRELLAADAAHTVRRLDLDRMLFSHSRRRVLMHAGAATAALVVAAALFAPSMGRATDVVAAYLFPARVIVEVSPGSTKIKAGQSLVIAARVSGWDGALAPTLTLEMGGEARAVRMEPTGEAREFALTLERVTAPFVYSVAAANARSDTYAVTVLYPPRVERIDLHYEFPQEIGLAPRIDEDSGDIYGPVGTSVRVTITADKPIAEGFLMLGDGNRVALDGASHVLDALLRIEEDGSYRVALADRDGLESPGDTEYFIRTLTDRPPDVRILRPATDKQVTPVEEVVIEARADDDHGIASFDLVFQVPGREERAVPFRGAAGGLTASGAYTLFLEDLQVKPGDFVTYYARARDVNRGRRAIEARSDIFFLEVKPFEGEFVAAQSQAMGGGGSSDSMQGLAEAQKEIIIATWKLDARARRASDARSTGDIKAISRAQTELKTRAEQQGDAVSRATGAARRRPAAGGAAPNEDPLGRAIEAMGRAVHQLEQLDTAAALPHEMEALSQLLKAEADNQRRQVARQQQGMGGGMNRASADLSTLFDQELRRRQETNYETPNTIEQREEPRRDDALEQIRELARRQDALNRQQRDLARNRDRLEEEQLKRQLERLTREQNELRQMAEQLSRQMQQRSGQSGQGQSGASQGQNGRQLREISEEMRSAATNLGRQNQEQASASGTRAAERLRDLERQLQSSGPDNRRRALGDLQLETRQLADAQRRLASEAGRSAQGQAGDDARRRLAGEQERLAERAERLQENVRRLSRSGEGGVEQRRATEDAARELERQRLPDRMRQQAQSLRQGAEASAESQVSPDGARATREGDQVARALDRVADQLGAASGAQDADSHRLSDQLGRTQELRERINELEQLSQELQRQGQAGESGDAGPQEQAQQGRGAQTQGDAGSPRGRHPQGGQQAEAGSPSSGQAEQSDAGSAGNGGARAQQLEQELSERMRELQRLTADIQRESPGLLSGTTPESPAWRVFSAPGTEGFKQDFARWESLKQHLLITLEEVEASLSDRLRTHEARERLNAGGHHAVADTYRELVEKYYRSLASPRRPQ